MSAADRGAQQPAALQGLPPQRRWHLRRQPAAAESLLLQVLRRSRCDRTRPGACVIATKQCGIWCAGANSARRRRLHCFHTFPQQQVVGVQIRLMDSTPQVVAKARNTPGFIQRARTARNTCASLTLCWSCMSVSSLNRLPAFAHRPCFASFVVQKSSCLNIQTIGIFFRADVKQMAMATWQVSNTARQLGLGPGQRMRWCYVTRSL